MLVVMPEDLYAKLLHPPRISAFRIQRAMWTLRMCVDGPGAHDEAITVHRFNEQFASLPLVPTLSGIMHTPIRRLSHERCPSNLGNAPAESFRTVRQFIHYVDGSTGSRTSFSIADVLGNESHLDDHDHYGLTFSDRTIPPCWPRPGHHAPRSGRTQKATMNCATCGPPLVMSVEGRTSGSGSGTARFTAGI